MERIKDSRLSSCFTGLNLSTWAKKTFQIKELPKIDPLFRKLSPRPALAGMPSRLAGNCAIHNNSQNHMAMAIHSALAFQSHISLSFSLHFDITTCYISTKLSQLPGINMHQHSEAPVRSVPKTHGTHFLFSGCVEFTTNPAAFWFQNLRWDHQHPGSY